MRLIPLIAREPMTYAGAPIGAGERFDATPIDAAVLTYRHRAAFAPRGSAAAPPATPSSEVHAELAGEDSEVPAGLRPEPAGDETPKKARKKRIYQRRDLEPEA